MRRKESKLYINLNNIGLASASLYIILTEYTLFGRAISVYIPVRGQGDFTLTKGWYIKQYRPTPQYILFIIPKLEVFV